MTTFRRMALALLLYALATVAVVTVLPPGGARWAVSTALFLAFAAHLAGLARRRPG
jgi:hypothetical protein